MAPVSERRGHSADDYLEAVYSLVFPVGAYRPADAATPIAARVADMLGVSRAAVVRVRRAVLRDGDLPAVERLAADLVAVVPRAVVERLVVVDRLAPERPAALNGRVPVALRAVLLRVVPLGLVVLEVSAMCGSASRCGPVYRT